MSFFLEKKLIKVSCTHILAPFILQNFRKILRAYPELGRCSIFEPKIVHFSWTKFCGTNHYYYFTFIYLLPLFIVQNLWRNSYSESRVMKMPHFSAQNGLFASFSLPPPVPPPTQKKKKEIEKKSLISFSSNYWPLSLCKVSKKFLQRIQSYADASFLDPKWPI